MKHILYALTLSFVCVYISLNAQDVLDPNHIIGNIHHPVTNAQFNFENCENTFIRGWNWGTPGALLDSALHINAYHQARLYAYLMVSR